MKKSLCLPLSKSNWPEGRIGPNTWQDAHRVQKLGAHLVKKNQAEKLLLLSELIPRASKRTELDYVIDSCRFEKINEEFLDIRKVGYDTISQIEYAIKICEDEKSDLIIVSSQFHFPRVIWLSKRLNKSNIKIKNKIAWGIPRITDVFSDIFLIFTYPIIDILGYSRHFTAYVKTRRDKGII
jgi:hypothetical protein